MTDRPILFSAPMVRALIDGTKTQTRRIIKPQPLLPWNALFHEGSKWWTGDCITGEKIEDLNVRFSVGDQLYVRETFSGPYERQQFKVKPALWFSDDPIWYWADGSPDHGDWTIPKPGIHMPRWASRLTLTVVDVRVQRLQDISEEDARAEGGPFDHNGDHYDAPSPQVDSWQGYGRASFCLLWNSINGRGAWEANPFVAAVTFNVYLCNIDAMVQP